MLELDSDNLSMKKNDEDGSGGRKNDVTVCYVGSYFLETA